MPDKMSRYHWLKIKLIFQIYCADGTCKLLVPQGEFLPCVVGILSVILGQGGMRQGDLLTASLLTLGVCPGIPREFFATKPAQSLTSVLDTEKILLFSVCTGKCIFNTVDQHSATCLDWGPSPVVLVCGCLLFKSDFFPLQLPSN